MSCFATGTPPRPTATRSTTTGARPRPAGPARASCKTGRCAASPRTSILVGRVTIGARTRRRSRPRPCENSPMQPSLDLSGNVAQTVRFEESAHRYFVEPSGREIPGVTRALEEAGLIDFSMVPRDVLLKAQDRGTRVHQALHYLDDGELDQDTLDEE